MNFLQLNIIFPPATVNSFVSLKLLEFGHSNNFYLLFVQQYECTPGQKKEKYQMKVIFALKNSTFGAHAAYVYLYPQPQELKVERASG